MRPKLTRLASLILPAVLLAATSPPTRAEVGDGSKWVGGGETVTFDVTLDATVNVVRVTVTDSNGTSGTVDGTPGENSSLSAPTVQETPGGGDEGTPMRTPGESGKPYRVERGKPQYQDAAGRWHTMTRLKEDGALPGGVQRLVAGQSSPGPGHLWNPWHPTLELVTGQRAPWGGWYVPGSPGEEVVTLPTDPTPP